MAKGQENMLGNKGAREVAHLAHFAAANSAPGTLLISLQM